MSNPFNFMNRRGFLKASFLAALASTPIGKAVAAVPVTSKVVGDVSSNSFTLAITASTTVRAYIEYGYGKSTILGKTPFITVSKGTTQNLTISGLKANTVVYYRVKYAIGTSLNYASLAQKSLKTAATQALSASTFAVQADPHMDENSSGAVYDGTLKQIVAASPAFLMDLGDIFMVDKLQSKTEANIRARFELMKGYY